MEMVDYNKVMIDVLNKIIEEEWRHKLRIYCQLSTEYTFEQFLKDKNWQKE